MNFLATGLGINSKLKLSYCGLLSHAIYTISVIGGFYIYIFLDYFLKSSPDTDNNGLGSSLILLVTSLPLLGLFAMGIYSCVLAIMVEEELDARTKQDQEGRQPRVNAPVDVEMLPVST